MFVMNPEAIITKICNAIDQIMEGSKPYEGLFPSIMHPQTGDMLMEKPPKIPGQRDGDRAYLGSNLIHDEPLLATMHTLAETESHLPELANQMRQYALVYIDGFLACTPQPRNTQNRRRRIRRFMRVRDELSSLLVERMSVWGSVYGAGTVWGACGPAVLCLGGWRLTQNERLMEWARAVGNTYLNEKFPANSVHTEGFKIPAADVGLALELFADLYDITGESVWLEGGTELAEIVLDIYFPETLPFGASGIDWYESQMGPAFLIHGLGRVALLALSQTSSDSCPLAPNYTAR